MYQIRNAGAKGFGIFATRPIPRGTRILAEKPILTVKTERDLFAATQKLDPKDREFLAGLSINELQAQRSTLQSWAKITWDVARGSGGIPSLVAVKGHAQILAAFKNNNFAITSTAQALFHDISRLNHACIPNTQGNFNSILGKFTIHSLRAIEAEEELTLSYLEPFATVREQRQAKLKEGYGFECACPACDLGKKRARDGERRRQGLKERLERMMVWQREGKRDFGSEHELLLEVIRVFEAEGLAGRELGTM